MQPDPRADYLMCWQYAMVAMSLRGSAKIVDDARKARTLLMWAHHYERLARKLPKEPARLKAIS